MSDLSWFGFVGLAASVFLVALVVTAPLMVLIAGVSAFVSALPLVLLIGLYVAVLAGTIIYLRDRWWTT